MSGTIRAFVGPNGSGKTLAAVVGCVVPTLRAGRVVRSNCAIDPTAIGCERSLYEPIGSVFDMLEMESCLLLLDEITACFPSRSYSSMPVQIQRLLNQLRKQDVDVAWTAPNWSRCDVILREVTQEVTACRGHFPDKYERDREGVVRDHKGKKVRRQSRWPANRLFRWATYDAIEYDDYQDRRINAIKARRNRWYWRPWHRDQWSYQTLQPVDLLDHLDELGTCLVCGGHRRKRSCTCKPALEQLALEDDRAGSAGVPAGVAGPVPPLAALLRRNGSE